MNKNFWNNKRVFLTGHTGFKGSWLSMWLSYMGAKVYGYALKPPTNPSLFEQAKVRSILSSHTQGDIRDLEKLSKSLKLCKPDIVIHMAAQPLVRDSYIIPRETYETNVMGTVNILEAIRKYYQPKVFLNVTTDKVYENIETTRGYKETDPLGGYDPYSSSKACSEIVTSSYRSSFFNFSVLVSSARAGNVIGGGDWAKDRLIPDIIRAILEGKKVLIRNPHSIRPWQHVLECLSGYMSLCEKMYIGGKKYCGPWNFGPDEKDLKPVIWIVKKLLEEIKPNKGYTIARGIHPHEAKLLVLNTDKSKKLINRATNWDIENSIKKISDWVNRYSNGDSVAEICFNQIKEYINEK